MLQHSKGAAVQKHQPIAARGALAERGEPFTVITETAPIAAATHGGRAKCLQRLIRLGLPVPRTVALSFDAVHEIAAGHYVDFAPLIAAFGEAPLLSVRASSADPDWGGPGAILNIGMSGEMRDRLAGEIGEAAANALYLRFIHAYAVHVARLDAELFDIPEQPDQGAIERALVVYEEETDEPFPQSVEVQLGEVLRSMARAWEGPTARLLRQARGAPPDAGLGLVVQEMALGLGPPESGAGVIQFVNSATGEPQITGRYLSQAQGREALLPGAKGAIYLTRDPRGPSLEELCPKCFAELVEYGRICRERLREEMQIEFTLSAGRLHVLDAVRVARSSRAAVRIAVDLAEDGIISRADALLRIPPRALTDLLHPQVDPRGKRDVLARGVAASPGAAVGRLVFSSTAAQAAAARDEKAILVRRETTPEDVRGMHAAAGVLTERGGMTSHAAVIARGLGVPCVVGADIEIDQRERLIRCADGRVLREGEVITLDGTAGEVLAGAAPLLEPALDGAFRKLMDWAEAASDIDIRANADTPADAERARNFGARGIGLCRTEHMFFEEDRLGVMREMIFAETPEDRAAVLEMLLPMQREDFLKLFRIMEGLPVCIRLFDPPLHEFLPHDREGLRELAESLDMPIAEVTRRVEALSEFNPMLGMRGVRLGITVPEIYDMQARAIFEATVEAKAEGAHVVPEIMIPLVSARREVELVKTRIDAVAAAVRNERGQDFTYRLGVMVETPRAALRADEIAHHAAFLSFGTNDLTQMTYGLSRDDAGRFMSAYVKLGVFPEDPFHVLDTEGVGELLSIGAARGRAARPDLTLAICGEHGGNPESIAFCRDAGYDYVSCSPYRVPVARLAAAHLALRDPRRGPGAGAAG
ncbi:pyruvate, orthophosphate dikinase [Meinhardsimonia xiamenensis]|jgi:pyruvate,orthophosphate dikinase|uniref:Pyruvate, phosphate dikinase n=1 Tax=Meinhardsimonia xiamenensis TaxID=990712 RepID=A0A1G9D0J7_9RHOB|nr:putative PEP-binding protein [Meinhardsimonia xiamenensis]PRX38174.1 pyruvate,orthophosphate dikinase [Meinhardsimonia xiamenensis]SDK57442.1 pyruvate, orthophosphate dikinase [Meinhardsimonia xiamenensis]